MASVPSQNFPPSPSLWQCPSSEKFTFQWQASLVKVFHFHFLHSSVPHKKLHSFFKWQAYLVKVLHFHFFQSSVPYKKLLSLFKWQESLIKVVHFHFLHSSVSHKKYFHFSNGKRPQSKFFTFTFYCQCP